VYLISEKTASGVVSIEAAIPLMEQVFAAFEGGGVEHLPVTITTGFTADSTFGAKGCIIRSMGIFGFKIGCYFPDNPTRGFPSHGSTTILLDPDSGFPMAMIGAKHLSAIRTAALDAVAIRHLSRPDSRTLAVIGCGKQAWQDFLAARLVRPIERVLAWSRTPSAADAFARRVTAEAGLSAESCGLESAVRAADIVITATPSATALVEQDWVRPGTHISAMGADTKGKQELSPALVVASRLFADLVEQSITIGEFKAAFNDGLICREAITPIGRVLQGLVPPRSEADITIFDSSGTAAQDLVVAKVVMDAAIASGQAVIFDEAA
jgi:alanine dehydrogenase